jgi:lysophospholipid acyltransferase (LPLAT)-like uncharacterized protein
LKIRSPFLVGLAGLAFATAMRLLFWTLRLDVRTSEANPYASSGSARYLFSVWHDSMILAAFGGPHLQTIALTSQHRDGSFVASVLKAIGVSTVRGSTGHTGGNALREMLSAAKGKDIVITPDGPRGPQHQMSRGIVFIASHTGNAIVPTAFSCGRAWRIRGNWTDLVIPRPFSKVLLLAGQPIDIPPRLTEDEFAGYLAHVQSEMDRLRDRAERISKAA